jgi:hypothetical protein
MRFEAICDKNSRLSAKKLHFSLQIFFRKSKKHGYQGMKTAFCALL